MAVAINTGIEWSKGQIANANATTDRNAVTVDSLANGASNGLLETSINVSINYKDTSGKPAVIGLIQSFSVSEQRNVTKLQEIGTLGVVQGVPNNTNGGTIQTSRIALYGTNLAQAFGINPVSGNAFLTLKDQNVPFEIVVVSQVTALTQTITSDQAAQNITAKDLIKHYRDVYTDCWIQQYSKPYTIQNITVAESATISYADVYGSDDYIDI